MVELRTGPDTVLISREAHVLREGGAFLGPDQRWLTAEDDGALDRAAEVAAAADAGHIEVVQVAGRSVPRRLGRYTREGGRTVEFLPGLSLRVVRYGAPAAG